MSSPTRKEGARIRRLQVTPWDNKFRGGTEISKGLTMAREMLEEHKMTEHGVLLISDLDNAQLDDTKLTREVILYRAANIPLHIVAFPRSTTTASSSSACSGRTRL